MKRFYFLITCSFFLISFNALCQWKDLNLDKNQNASNFNFLNNNVGYSNFHNKKTNSHTIEKTIDGGNTWTPINTPKSSEFRIDGISFYEEGKGVIVYYDSTSQASILSHTKNDGLTWENISPKQTRKFKIPLFLDDKNGFVCHEGTLFRTNDGGKYWSKQVLQERYHITSIDFFDSKSGTIGLWDVSFNVKGAICSTTDGGRNWSTILFSQQNYGIGKVIQFNKNVAYAAPMGNIWGGTEFKIFKTNDIGNSWDTIVLPNEFINGRFNNLAVLNESEMVAVVRHSGGADSYSIYESRNEGKDWTNIQEIALDLPHLDKLQIELTPNSGYISGGFGELYKWIKKPVNIENEEAQKQTQLFINHQSIFWESDINFTNATIFNMQGQSILDERIGQNKKLNISMLKTGIYVVLLKNESNQFKKKVMIN